MRKDITIEKIMLGGESVNKSALARQYGCCWETIDRRLNPDKYKKEKKTSQMDNSSCHCYLASGYSNRIGVWISL